MFHFVYITFTWWSWVLLLAIPSENKRKSLINSVQVYWFCHIWLFLMQSNIYVLVKEVQLYKNRYIFFLKNLSRTKTKRVFWNTLVFSTSSFWCFKVVCNAISSSLSMFYIIILMNQCKGYSKIKLSKISVHKCS